MALSSLWLFPPQTSPMVNRDDTSVIFEEFLQTLREADRRNFCWDHRLEKATPATRHSNWYESEGKWSFRCAVSFPATMYSSCRIYFKSQNALRGLGRDSVPIEDDNAALPSRDVMVKLQIFPREMLWLWLQRNFSIHLLTVSDQLHYCVLPESRCLFLFD